MAGRDARGGRAREPWLAAAPSTLCWLADITPIAHFQLYLWNLSGFRSLRDRAGCNCRLGLRGRFTRQWFVDKKLVFNIFFVSFTNNFYKHFVFLTKFTNFFRNGKENIKCYYTIKTGPASGFGLKFVEIALYRSKRQSEWKGFCAQLLNHVNSANTTLTERCSKLVFRSFCVNWPIKFEKNIHPGCREMNRWRRLAAKRNFDEQSVINLTHEIKMKTIVSVTGVLRRKSTNPSE